MNPVSAPLRRAAPVGLLFAALASGFLASSFRYLEARATTVTFPLLGLGTTHYRGRDKFLATDLGIPVQFTLSQQCGVLLLVVPVLLTAALLSRSRAIRSGRLAVGLAVAVLGLIAVNQLRLGLIAWCIRWVGFDDGFPLGHLFLGSILSIFGLIAAIVCLVRICRPHPRTGGK